MMSFTICTQYKVLLGDQTEAYEMQGALNTNGKTRNTRDFG
jgi:hypothetical protein